MTETASFGRCWFCWQPIQPARPRGCLPTPARQNFDLSHWQLTLPVDSSGGSNGTAVEIDPSDLTAGYLNAPYFCTGGDGAIVFECPAVGATTRARRIRETELRELINTNDNSIDWPPNGYNVLTAQCAVNGVAPGGSLGLGQIHGYSVNIPLVILRYDNTLNQGTIDATVKYMSDGTPYNNHTDNVLTFTNVGLKRANRLPVGLEQRGGVHRG